MRIKSNFDSGNIEVISAESENNIQLAIKLDNNSGFYQWFHFRLESKAGKAHKLFITNASKSAYVNGWKDYLAMASYDRENWFRVPTDYDGTSLIISHTPAENSCYYAYFVPYSYERHLDLLHWAQSFESCTLETLGETLDGRDMSMLTIGTPTPEKNNVWVIARQHPGETMAEWFIEGLLERLLDAEDGVSRQLLDKAVFYVVPNMNPDGSVRGHLRTNAKGVNLNREWLEPSMEQSPEVFLVKQKMRETGVDMHLDVHGDEALPYNFVAGSEGVPGYNQRIENLENSFKQAFLIATPEFQDDKGYPKDAPGKANLTICSNNICHEFDCLSYTLEMPFKDNANLSDSDFGWNDARSKQLGQDILIAIRAVVDQLR